MRKNVLTFVIYLIHILSESLGKSPTIVYKLLTRSKILDTYIIPSYDVLHTLGKQYLIEDITSLVKERGLAWK